MTTTTTTATQADRYAEFGRSPMPVPQAEFIAGRAGWAWKACSWRLALRTLGAAGWDAARVEAAAGRRLTAREALLVDGSRRRSANG